jgi:alpha-tubulin suppressor-like RCC1 family protein
MKVMLSLRAVSVLRTTTTWLFPLLLAACGGGSGSAPPSDPAATVAAIEVGPAEVSLYWGYTAQLTSRASAINGNAVAGRTVAWSSSDTTVATVDGSGLVTLRTPGSARITASADGVTSNASVVTVRGFDTASLRVTAQDNCATDETKKDIFCWGDGYPIRPNQPLELSYPNPTRLARGQIPAGASVVEIAPGFRYSCALTDEPRVYCWAGANSEAIAVELAALGTGSATPIAVPNPVLPGEIPLGATLSKLRNAGNAACVVANNEVYCWGTANALPNPAQAQRPVNRDLPYTAPVRIARGAFPAGETIVDLVTGNSKTCVIGSVGRVYCAVSGTFVALPQGEVPGNVRLVKLSNGARNEGFVGALGDDGWVYTFGGGFAERFGNGSTAFEGDDSAIKRLGRGVIPVGVRLVDVSIGGIAGASCALGDDGKAYCWSRGYFGSLGDGDLGEHTARTPVAVVQGEVPAGVRFVSVACGTYHCTAMGSDRLPYAWGYSEGTAIGQPVSSGSKAAPTLVSRPLAP